MQVTIAAASRHDLPEGRSVDYYGDNPQDWNPYHPASARPLAYVAEDLVRSLNYQATIASFDEESGPPEGKQPPSRPEILLVDRWALQDEDRRRRLAAFDAENRPWVTMVVPWNREDPQSRAAEAELTAKLEQTMPTKMRQGRAYCRAAAGRTEHGGLRPGPAAGGRGGGPAVPATCRGLPTRDGRRAHRTDPADRADGADALHTGDTPPCDGCGGHG